jgi:outer membrane lipoprotein-sorting protein
MKTPFKKSILRRGALLTSCLIISAAALPAHAMSDEEKGYEIAKASDRSDRGFNDHKVGMKMVLRNAQGQETTREMRFSVKEVPDENEGDKSLIIFEAPADIAGTALLSHTNILTADNQWLLFPESGKVARISSRNKSGPFVGSEFAFEDFTSQELNKYKYKFLRQETCPNATELTCDVVERFPLYERSGYTRQIGWTDTKTLQTRKIDFYDRKDSLLKTLNFTDYELYNDKYWRVHVMKMVNHQTGKSTDLVYGDYSLNNGLDDKDFVKGVLNTLY